MARFIRTSVDFADRPSDCPACGAAVATAGYLYEEGDATSYFMTCGECSFIFCRPLILPELDERQMDGIDNAEMFNSRLMKKLYVILFIRRELAKIRKHHPRRELSLLDIGCGTGWTSSIYAAHGFRVTGLEPSAPRATVAREKYGLRVIDDYLENLTLEETFDVIVFRHVIEHFADPASLVRSARRLLAPGGCMLVVVPNINCLGRYLFDTRWAWILPWHCNFFTPKSLRVFLRRSGFEVVDLYQTPSPLYFPGSFARRFPGRLSRWLVTKHKVAAMLALSPLAVAGSLLGMGDNLNAVVRVDPC